MAKQISLNIDALDADSKRAVLNGFQQAGDVPYLHAATRLGNVEVVAEYLSESGGGDVNVRDSGNRTMAHIAARVPGVACSTLLEMYRDQGGDLDAQANGGLSILHIATFWRNQDAMRQLLEAGANPNIQNLQGDTPLMVALLNDDLEGARTLLEFNASPVIANARGQTPLDACVSLDAMQLVQKAISTRTLRLPGL